MSSSWSQGYEGKLFVLTLARLMEAARQVVLVADGGKVDLPVRGLTCDSRQAGTGMVFVAIRGERADGHEYVATALAAGCVAVVVEQEIPGADRERMIRVTDSHLALALMAAALYRWPAREMNMIGITGTNGKTTTSWIIEALLQADGRRPGVIGTVNYRYGNGDRFVCRPASLTTPDPVMLHGLLREMADAGVTDVVLEASSHALVQQRLGGIEFNVGVFTNLSRDHLDYHGTMEEYFAAKQRLFLTHLASDGTAVVIDDNGGDDDGAAGWGGRLISILRDNRFRMGRGGKGGQGCISCDMDGDCMVHAKGIRQDINGSVFSLVLGNREVDVRTKLIGQHNILNILAAAGSGTALGIRPKVIAWAMAELSQVPGRLERVSLPPYEAVSETAAVFVDYAHTPDALENVLRTLRPLTGRRLFCVFGCGGDRDRGKRRMMGRIAGELADRVVLTSDNPRSEDPAAIIREIEQGLLDAGCSRTGRVTDLVQERKDSWRRFSVMADRREAIHQVCTGADKDDVVLIAGKGHETYQLSAGGKRFFDDRLEAGDSGLRWKAESLAQATGGVLQQVGDGGLLGEVSTDTRTIQPGDIFLALQGENFDGHAFIEKALAKGARGLVISKPCRVRDLGVAVVMVDNCLKALGDLASYRRQLLAPRLNVVGITGSSGKTTVKELTAAIFNAAAAGDGEQVLKTEGNLNNLVGMPLSLLRARTGHGTAVLEMGMNRPGEIDRLTTIADPDIGCITNVGSAHLEGLGSIEGVARAKKELFAAMRPAAIRVINFDDPNIRNERGVHGNSVIGFGVTPSGRRLHPAVRATRIKGLGERGMRFTLHVNDWRQRITIPAPGKHNVANCAAAAAIATAAGIGPEAIVTGLVSYAAGDKRMQMVELPGGIRLLNDCYNANPSSMAAALRTVSSFEGAARKFAVLGDMLELGTGALSAHREIGKLVAELAFAGLLVKGEFATNVADAALAAGMAKAAVTVCAGTREMAELLAAMIGDRRIVSGDWILLKGSRGMRMEQVVEGLTERLQMERN